MEILRCFFKGQSGDCTAEHNSIQDEYHLKGYDTQQNLLAMNTIYTSSIYTCFYKMFSFQAKLFYLLSLTSQK